MLGLESNYSDTARFFLAWMDVGPAYFTNPDSPTRITSQSAGWEAQKYTHKSFQVPDRWAGRFWGRRNCKFPNSGPGSCATGGCNGGLVCDHRTGSGVPPATLAEFKLNGDGGKDYYDVSNVDGSNLPVRITNNKGCPTPSCGKDLNRDCPNDRLKVRDGNGATIGCLSACQMETTAIRQIVALAVTTQRPLAQGQSSVLQLFQEGLRTLPILTLPPGSPVNPLLGSSRSHSTELRSSRSLGRKVLGKRNCDFSKSGLLHAPTGGCNGGLVLMPKRVQATGDTCEFKLNGDGGQDFYDVSNVDGSNLPVRITNNKGCPTPACPNDLNPGCPDDRLKVRDGNGVTIGCLSACQANLDGNHDNSATACTGSHNHCAHLPERRVQFYDYFKNNCPDAYAYAYDESSQSALWTCNQPADYTVTFCPKQEGIVYKVKTCAWDQVQTDSPDCPKDKPNLWCGSTADSSTISDCRLATFYNGCQDVGSGRIGPEVKCCGSKVHPSGQYGNINCQTYAHQCSNFIY
ncbi:hypothetical protein PSHT_15725 [Puccinia striiformis]|uniref:Thaumatin-like protein n=1 Tax=Puccinia striiformis TaxID=27350 RepID=A0A2S4UDI3_9BASI|nr:hypothetical protein PSHT_15725 [Puccinia striiformis]